MATKETRKIMGLGGSKVVSLPMNWTDYHNVNVGDTVEVITKDKTVIIRLIEKKEGEGNGCNSESEG